MSRLSNIWKLSKESLLPMIVAWKEIERTAYRIGLQVGDVLTYEQITQPGILQAGQVWKTNRQDCDYIFLSISEPDTIRGYTGTPWIIEENTGATKSQIINSIWHPYPTYQSSTGPATILKENEPFELISKDNGIQTRGYRTEPEVIQKGDRVELIDDCIDPPASQAYPIPAGSRGEVRIVYGGHFVVRLDEYDNPNQFHIDNGGTPDEYNDGGWIWTADEIRKIYDRPTALASAEAILYSWIDPDGNVFNVGGDFHSAYAYRIVKEKFPDLFQRAQERLKDTLGKGLEIDPLYAQNMLLRMGWVRTADYGITIGVPFNQVRRGLESYLEKVDSNKDVRVEKYFYDASGDISAYQSIFDGKVSELLDEIVHNGSRLDWIGREVKGYRTNYPDRSDPQSWVGWLIYYTDDGGEFPRSWTVVLYAEPCGRLWGVWEDHSEQGAIDFANNVELRNAVTNIIKENPIDISYGARHKVFDKHNVKIDFMECGNSVIHYNREVF